MFYDSRRIYNLPKSSNAILLKQQFFPRDERSDFFPSLIDDKVKYAMFRYAYFTLFIFATDFVCACVFFLFHLMHLVRYKFSIRILNHCISDVRLFKIASYKSSEPTRQSQMHLPYIIHRIFVRKKESTKEETKREERFLFCVCVFFFFCCVFYFSRFLKTKGSCVEMCIRRIAYVPEFGVHQPNRYISM